MDTENPQALRWGLYAKVIIAVFALLEVLRWRILPQFMDSYYHLLTAWGFIQAGGYSGWDFWQYAPVGRPHIYPPALHFLLAFFIKLGADKIFLARFFETVIPLLFLILLQRFIKKNYGARLSFFVLLALSSSFSFYVSLANHLAATLALILGLLAFGRLLRRQFWRAALLLALGFYTHIGVAGFFALALFFYGLMLREETRPCLSSLSGALVLAIPILFKQAAALPAISISGISARYACEFKTLEYLLAFLGLWLARKAKGHRIFTSLFLASFIFILYPYRFFSAQGYLAIILLTGAAMEEIYVRLSRRSAYQRSAVFLLAIFLLLVSPTLLIERSSTGRFQGKLYYWDSALADMLFPGRNLRLTASTMWFDREYRQMAQLIQENSRPQEIIYSTVYNVGVCLASISGRATANSLFPELGPLKKFNPFSAAKLIIALQDDDPAKLNSLVESYNLLKIGENRLFVCYKNPGIVGGAIVRKASVPFAGIIFLGLVYLGLFFAAGKTYPAQRTGFKF